MSKGTHSSDQSSITPDAKPKSVNSGGVEGFKKKSTKKKGLKLELHLYARIVPACEKKKK